MQCKGRCDWPVYRSSFFPSYIIERAYENKNRRGFIDRQRKGASLQHSQRLEACMKVFRCSTDYRIRISGLRVFFNTGENPFGARMRTN